MNQNDRNKEQLAEQEVREFIKILKRDYDVTIDDLLWMRDYHRSVQKYGDWIAKAIVASVIGSLLYGLGYAIILGFGHIIEKYLKVLQG